MEADCKSVGFAYAGSNPARPNNVNAKERSIPILSMSLFGSSLVSTDKELSGVGNGIPIDQSTAVVGRFKIGTK